MCLKLINFQKNLYCFGGFEIVFHKITEENFWVETSYSKKSNTLEKNLKQQRW